MSSRRLLFVDWLGVAFLGALGIWAYVSAWVAGGAPSLVAGLCVVCGAAFIMGLGSGHAKPVGAIAVAAGSAAFGLVYGVLYSAPLSDPLGYSNSSAAFFLQAFAAALMVAATQRRREAEALSVILALGFAALVIASGSAAATVLLALPAAAAAIVRRSSVRRAVAGFGALALVALSVTIALGASFAPDHNSGRLDRFAGVLLTEVRPTLWHDALTLMLEEPVAGVGPGRFAVKSPTARSDPDLGWAHNDFLEQGAETGVPGFVLMVLIFAWGFGRLLLVRQPDTVTALGASSLAALAIHACIDYVLHFPLVPFVAAVLVGTAVGRTREVRQWANERRHHPQFART
jgi:hypothetical protein